MGIYMDKNRNLYVVDDGRQSVARWAPGATSGVTVAGGNGKGSALNQFYTPVDVVVDNDKNVYVSDDLSASVRKWAPGAITGTIAAGGHGEGGALNQLFGTQSICIDRFGNLFIVELWNARVTKWVPGATEGIIVAGGHGPGSAANQLGGPRGVGVDYLGNVYVSETGNNRVTRWAPGATEGVIVAGGHGPGTAANQLSYPGEMCVDSVGNVYVIDGGTRVQKWAPGASYGITVAGGYGYMSINNNMELDKIGSSWGLFVDNNENIYISDLFQGRIRKFSKGPINNDQINDATTGTYKVEILSTTGKIYTSSPLHIADVPSGLPKYISGTRVVNNHQLTRYSVTEPVKGATYTWEVTNGVVQTGQGTPNVAIRFGIDNSFISVTAASGCGISKTKTIYVQMNPPDTANIQGKPAITLYPNPTTTVASVSFTAARATKYEVTLTNMMGKQLLKQQGNASQGKNKIDLNVAHLNKDIYLVNLKYDNNTTLLKLQKQ